MPPLDLFTSLVQGSWSTCSRMSATPSPGWSRPTSWAPMASPRQGVCSVPWH